MHKYLFSFVLLIFAEKALSQTSVTPVTTMTPSSGSDKALSSAKQGDVIDVDLYTGEASVNIPIYNYSNNGLNLGVSLSYNTKGIKVDEIASNVGIGWSLNAAPSITRQVNELEDEIILSYTNTSNVQKFITGNWTCDGNTNHYDPNVPSTPNYHHRGYNQDLFIVNLGGRQIQFTIDFEGSHFNNFNHPDWYHTKVSTYPKSEVKIELLYDGALIKQGINWWNNSTCDSRKFGFRITDENNNVFIFDKVDWRDKTYKPWDMNGAISYLSNTQWYASKIILKNGAEIKYTYANNTVDYPLDYTEEIAEVFSFTGHNHNTGWFTINSMKPQISKVKEDRYYGQTKRLVEINYDNGINVKFLPETNLSRKDLTGGDILSKIRIESNYTNGNYIEYNLVHHYFNALGTYNYDAILPLNTNVAADQYNLRLKLSAIYRMVNNGPAETMFDFTYDNTMLPPRFSPKQDYYGYYNGQSPITLPSYEYLNNTSVAPKFGVPKHSYTWTENNITYTRTYGVNKTPDVNYLKANILKKVKNSYGGTFELYYEPHVLNNTVSSSFISNDEDVNNINSYDGLRIQKIVFTDGFNTDNDYSTEYTYSNGELFNKRLYCWYPSNVSGSIDHMPSAYYPTPSVIVKNWTNSYVNPIELFEGSNHGYSNIAVLKKGYNNELISKQEYRYSNLTALSDEVQPNVLLDWNQASVSRLRDDKSSAMHIVTHSRMLNYQMGKLLEEKTFVGNANTPQGITKYEYEHVTFNELTHANWIAKYNMTRVPREKTSNVNASCPDYGDGFPTYTRIPENYNRVVIFTNNLLRLKKKTTTAYSGSSQMETSVEYTYDTLDNIVKISTKDSKGDEYVDERQYLYSYSPNVHPQYLKQSLQGKKVANDVAVTSFTLNTYDLSYTFLNKVASSKFEYPVLRSWNNYTETDDFEITLRDHKNNVIETKYEGGLKYGCQLLDYKCGSVIASIDNAKYNDIGFTSFEGLSGSPNSFEEGNWTFPTSAVKLASTIPMGKAITGKYVYQLSSSDIITKELSQNTKYLLSFWSDITPVVTLNGTPITLEHNLTVQGWQLFTAYITTNGFTTWQTLNITRNGGPGLSGYIDELRIRPANSKMITYTHEPLFGVSSTCDDRNNIIYTEYDVQGRPWRTKDILGNILSQTDRTIQGNN